MRPSRLVAAAIVAVVSAGLLGGCSAAPKPIRSETPVVTGVSAELRPYYGQRLDWRRCAGTFECGTAAAPLDWARPGGDRISLALIRHQATGDQVGTLFVNPGGPGASAVDFLQRGIDGFFDPALIEHYDIVAWDPRGVGRSRPAVDCYGTAGLDRFLFNDPDLPQGSQRLRDDAVTEAKAFGRACLTRTGPLLAHVDTGSVVRDLDMLRGALGERTLNYFGFSYGTLIGAEYADRYPRLVRRMVLDGAVDPSISSFAQSLANEKAFGDALLGYLADCVRSSRCPFAGQTRQQAVQTIGALLISLRQSPIRAHDGREVNSAYLRTAIDASLYDRAAWDVLSEAFRDILRGQPDGVLALADSYVDRTASGYDGNAFEAIFAVNCLDAPSDRDPAVLRRQGEQLAAVDPLRDADNGLDLGNPVCADWPVAPVGAPHRVSAPGAPKILVLGTTADPATPYAWARSVAGQLDGVLLTYRGEGHTAYRNRDRCINDPVDRYLVSGTVPEPVVCD